MAKIRTLKAEYFRSEDTSGDLLVKSLGAGIICVIADDDGRFKASPAWIRSEIFPLDPVDISQVADGLAQLAARHVIRLYEVDGRQYGVWLNWKQHQPIPQTRYKASSLPPPPDSLSKRRQGAGVAHTARKHHADTGQADASAMPPRARNTEGKGIGVGKEPPYPPTAQANGQAPPDGGDEEPAQSIWTADELQQRTVEILTWWAALSGQDLTTLANRQAQLTQERAITVARKPYEVADMCAAAEAWYGEMTEKPEHLYAPLMYPLFEQGGSAGIKKRKPHGLIRALVGSDPDEEPTTRPDNSPARATREATHQPAAQAETHGGTP